MKVTLILKAKDKKKETQDTSVAIKGDAIVVQAVVAAVHDAAEEAKCEVE